MATAKSIQGKIERRNSKLAELTAERESLLKEIRELDYIPHMLTYHESLSRKNKRNEIYKKIAQINKSMAKIRNELIVLDSEINSI